MTTITTTIPATVAADAAKVAARAGIPVADLYAACITNNAENWATQNTQAADAELLTKLKAAPKEVQDAVIAVKVTK